ncbi:MAG: hypothetical protein ACI4NM_06970 [Bullifex sp.]
MSGKLLENAIRGEIEDLLNSQVLKLFRFSDFASRILRLGVPEYGNCSISQIMSLLPLDGDRVEALESDLFFMDCDVLFKAELPSSGGKSILINIEARNVKPRSRRNLNRMVFYAASLLSDQYGKVFRKQRYEKRRMRSHL